MTVFERHLAGHFASLMALEGARDSGAPENLEGMIRSALIGTWDAALEMAAKIVEEEGYQVCEDIRGLKNSK